MVLLFFKQKTAYEMRISDWSSDVCSSDLVEGQHRDLHVKTPAKNDGPKGPRLYRAFEDIINPARPRGVSRKRSAQRDRQMRDRHDVRSEERRVGKEYARTVRSRWSP